MLQNKMKATLTKFGNDNEAEETTGSQNSGTDCEREKQWENTNKNKVKKERSNFLTLSPHTNIKQGRQA